MKRVLEGLKGKPVTAIWQDSHISQTQYYQWRDQFLSNVAKAFEGAQQTEREARLQHENARLKKLSGNSPWNSKKATRRCELCALARIQALRAGHPFWGYRRIWAQLRFGDGLAVNQKRICGSCGNVTCWSHPIRG